MTETTEELTFDDWTERSDVFRERVEILGVLVGVVRKY